MKKLLEKLFRSIGFTPTEGKIVLLLVGAFLVGTLLKLGGVKTISEQSFNYSKADSEFVRRSKVISGYDLEQGPVDNNLSDGNDGGKSLQHKNTKDISNPVNLNKATKEQLMMLPGIGEATAERIIIYRQDHGEFTSPKQLLKVAGIGEKKFEQIKQLITVK